jgi:UDP-3-O-[3-hydroxymyristoyl] glucosamine N-acyltransferase
MKLREISDFVKGEVGDGADVEINHLAKIEEAQPGDITFLSNPKYGKYLATTQASGVLVAKDIEYKELSQRKTPIFLVRVPDPYIAFLQLVEVFYPKPNSLPVGVHPTAIIPSTSKVGDGAAIGAYVVVGENASIGKNTTIWHGTVLGDNVNVGENTLIYPNVSIREQCLVGSNVIIHSGTVVGSDGFGFAPKPDETYEKIPQRGRVVIEDDVEIGSNCSIDRATVIAAQAGISGSTKLGRNCIVAGQAGIVGHLQIANKTTIAAQSGIPKSITEEGKIYFGSPALEIAEMRRIVVAQRQLPKLLTEVESLKKRLEELEIILKGESKK